MHGQRERERETIPQKLTLLGGTLPWEDLKQRVNERASDEQFRGSIPLPFGQSHCICKSRVRLTRKIDHVPPSRPTEISLSLSFSPSQTNQRTKRRSEKTKNSKLELEVRSRVQPYRAIGRETMEERSRPERKRERERDPN